MTKSAIISKTEEFVTNLFQEKLSADYCYHNLQHTLGMRDAAQQLAEKQEVTEEEKEEIELACLLHDTGYTEAYAGHEAASHRIAQSFLKQQDYPQHKLEHVLQLIDATAAGAHPETMPEQIIKDADYVHLADENYPKFNEALRREWAQLLDRQYEDPEWYQLNYDFFKTHQYFTPAARQLFELQKNQNQKQLKKIVKKTKKTKIKTADSGALLASIGDSRSAQMMFKTSLRNHLDLSNLADNKSNIMLSVNALIITVAIPLVSSYAHKAEYIIYPMGLLMISCLISMIFATLATRPIKMLGYTSKEQIQAKESNLFFFGNFYDMSFQEYQEGIQQVIADEEGLDNTIMRDLFFLGRSLGTKYRQLRICYNIFMVGIVSTVLIFAICYGIWGID